MREERRTEAGEDFLKYVCDAGGSLPRGKMSKVMRRLNLDDTTARMYVLDHMRSRVEVFESMFIHSWQRQLEALLARAQALELG